MKRHFFSLDNDYMVADEEDFHVNLDKFVTPRVDSSFVDEESDLDEEKADNPMTKRDYKVLSRKVNLLVLHTQVFSTYKFQCMQEAHMGIEKTLFKTSAKLVLDTTTKVDEAVHEVKQATTKVDVVLKEVTHSMKKKLA